MVREVAIIYLKKFTYCSAQKSSSCHLAYAHAPPHFWHQGGEGASVRFFMKYCLSLFGWKAKVWITFNVKTLTKITKISYKVHFNAFLNIFDGNNCLLLSRLMWYSLSYTQRMLYGIMFSPFLTPSLSAHVSRSTSQEILAVDIFWPYPCWPSLSVTGVHLLNVESPHAPTTYDP